MARGPLGPNTRATELANMAGMSATRASPTVRIGVDKEADRRFAYCVLQIEEVRQDSVSIKMDGKVDDTIAGMSPKTVLTPAGLGDVAKASQVLDNQVSLEEAGDAGDTDLSHCIRRRPPIDQGIVVGGPWDPYREAVQNRLVDGRRGKGHSQEVRGRHVENVNDLVNTKLEVIDQEGISLVTGNVWLGSSEVNEDRVDLQKGKVMKREILDGWPVRATVATTRLAGRIGVRSHRRRKRSRS